MGRYAKKYHEYTQKQSLKLFIFEKMSTFAQLNDVPKGC